MDWGAGSDDEDLFAGSDWRSGSFFGDVDLAAVLPDDHAFLATAKRGRASPREAPPASNKRREVGELEPELLPAFGQNTLPLSEVHLADACPATLDRLRAAMAAPGPGDWAAPLRAESGAQRRQRADVLAQSVLKPATLLVLEQFLRFLDELDVELQLHERRARGETNARQLCSVALLSGGPNRPLKQKEAFGPIRVKVVSTLPDKVTVTKAALVTVDENGDSIDLSLRCTPKIKGDTVVFENVTVDKSTKKSLTWYEVHLTLGNNVGQVVKRLPEPFVVTTNEKQWEAAVGKIMQYHLFDAPKVLAVSRAQLCNALQKFYLEGIREANLADPKRPLSPADFLYIMRLRDVDDTCQSIARDQFLHIWEWFGSALQRIRHNPVVLEMWLQGYILGFATKQEAEQLLIIQAPGSFLLRFSSQAPGLFAIAYTSPDGESVKHYLVGKNDVNASYSMAKFLIDKPFFDRLLQTVPSFDEPRRKYVPKMNALGPWATKGDAIVPGYDETLNIPMENLSLK